MQDQRRAAVLFKERYGPLPASSVLARLEDLVARFSALPYENLSKILCWEAGLKAPRPRMPLQVMRDHLELGTGGTCFSLTELLRQLALDAGFSCHPLMAHMRHGHDIHCALRVEAGKESYLVDPGYLLCRPIPLRPSEAASAGGQAGEPFIVPAGSLPGVCAQIDRGELDLFTIEPDGPRWRYRLSLKPPGRDEFAAHWRESFFRPGMRSLLVSRRTDPQVMLYLHNHKLLRHGLQGKQSFNVRADLEKQVQQVFGIDPRVTRQARSLLQQQRQKSGTHGA